MPYLSYEEIERQKELSDLVKLIYKPFASENDFETHGPRRRTPSDISFPNRRGFLTWFRYRKQQQQSDVKDETKSTIRGYLNYKSGDSYLPLHPRR